VTGVLSYAIFFGIMVLIFGVATLGLNLQWGFTGLFNAGVVGFYAVGAYAFGILTAPARPEFIGNFDLPWAVGILGAIVVSAAAAVVIGLATIGLRGDYLAIATFGTAVAIQLFAVNLEPLTGGTNGLAFIPRPFGELFPGGVSRDLSYLCLIAFLVGVVYVGLERLVRSPWGRVLRSLREDEIAAIALGKDAARFRLQAFVLGATLIGLAGALYASFIGFVSPFDFLPIVTFQLWAMLIVGGSGNNRGALLGAVVVWLFWTGSGALIFNLLPSNLHTQAAAIQSILIGALLVLSLLFRPQGLLGEELVVSRHVKAVSS
jgi:branched-chain amino acid transport system permease protein